MNNLALIYELLDRLNEALLLKEKAYQLSLEIFGEKHPHTLINLNNLGYIYAQMGELLNEKTTPTSNQ